MDLMQALLPYEAVASTISWAILQNLEVVENGIVDIFVGGKGLSAYQYAGALAFFTLIFMGTLCILSLIAGWRYSKKFLLPVIFVSWFLPGVWAVFFPASFFRYWIIPERFVTGGGIGHMPVGTLEGGIYAVFLFLVAGWSVFSLIQDLKFLRQHFKSIIDHFWYPMGIVVAMMFLVENNQAQSVYEEFKSEKEKVSLVKEEMNNQIDLINNYLMDSQVNNGILMDVSRTSKSFVDWNLRGGGFFMESSGASDIFDYNLADFEAINRDVCIGEKAEVYCRKLPWTVSVPIAQEKVSSIDDLERPRLIFAHIMIDYVQAISRKISALNERKRQVQRLDSIRWFSLLLLAFIAGGKIASATRVLIPRQN